ncbi:MAG: hypothetical protein M3220_04810 [Chloroflexota bacterium]|nr:hypothetical protein [Chloroflexota bacterium]
MTVKIGISGLRGTVARGEESLTARTVVEWVQAFVAQLRAEVRARPFIALGHDARRSSPALAALAKGALVMAGADVLELGLTLTPTVQLAVRRNAHLSGGLMITASHNPVLWNGLKFLDAQGLFLPLSWWQAMRATIEEDNLPAVPLDAMGHVEQGGEAAWQAHQQAVLDALPVEVIRKQRYRVALDACNGGAVRWVETIRALGCEPILLHSEQHGFFAREAEPLPEHLDSLRHLVRHAGCDLGLAADPDGDRLVLVDAQGEAVNEEHTVVLAAMARARNEGERVAVNVVTTHALEETLPHAVVVRTAVGEMNVVQGAIESGAVLGGEGSGGIIVPSVNLARDGLAATGLILALMAEQAAPLHELVARIPSWRAIKTKLVTTEGSPDALRALFARWVEEAPEARLVDHTLHIGSADGSFVLALLDDRTLQMTGNLPGGDTVRATGHEQGLDRLFEKLHRQRAHISLDLTDGVKLIGEGAWLSLRPSNTEPVVRVMGEIRERGEL